MKVKKFVATTALIVLTLGVSAACGDTGSDQSNTVVCERTDEFVGNPECGYYVNGVEWVWNETPAPTDSASEETDIDLDTKTKKKKSKNKKITSHRG